MTTPKLTAKGLRTLTEIRTKIPIGGSCWIIDSNPHTQEPRQVLELIRKSSFVFETAEVDDEEHIPTIMTLTVIMRRSYGGVWLKKRDATNYLKLLLKFWKEAPKLIDKLAQEQEQKTVH